MAEFNRFTLMVMRSDKRENSVYLSLGTNIGDRLAHLKQATKMLQMLATEEIKVSVVYESAPWGNGLLCFFLNCVVHIKTTLDPFLLLQRTQEIEKEMGRAEKSTGKLYENRMIDIDILTFNLTTINSKTLAIPHPMLTNRRFVLLPFSDLAPHFQLPYSLYSIEKHLAVCEDYLQCDRFEAL